MSGDPDLVTTSKAIQILDQLGADVIELGVPYSVCVGYLGCPAALYCILCCTMYCRAQPVNIMQSHGILCWCKLNVALCTCTCALTQKQSGKRVGISDACRIHWLMAPPFRQLQLEPCWSSMLPWTRYCNGSYCSLLTSLLVLCSIWQYLHYRQQSSRLDSLG